jgi:hypothetical protein
MVAAATERRASQRVPFTCQAFFDRDGVVEKLQLRDFSDYGIGAYATSELKPGQQGMILVKYTGEKIRRYISEVVWCRPLADQADGSYNYSLGFKVLA